MIDYSISKITNPVTNRLAVYAVAQIRETLTLDQFAKHIADHGCAFDKGDIFAVLVKAASCLKELILDGKQVQMGDLGTFAPSLSTNGWNRGLTPDDDGYRQPGDFSASDIDCVTVHYKLPATLKNMRDEAEFNFVTTRKEQAAAKREAKEDLGTTSGGDGNLHL